ncbi:hypothetical protein SEA_BIG4_46 [Microbacterium phage Big4]|nr:hypothetical protein SEA_BIG4_46 [Microbacterium phage Big4]
MTLESVRLQQAKDRMAVLADRVQYQSTDENPMLIREGADVLLTALDRANEEAEFWEAKFRQAVEDLKGTHVNVYSYTLGLEPSPYERDRARERLEELREKAAELPVERVRWAGGELPTDKERAIIEARRERKRDAG